LIIVTGYKEKGKRKKEKVYPVKCGAILFTKLFHRGKSKKFVRLSFCEPQVKRNDKVLT
jgi:hypothetical protein